MSTEPYPLYLSGPKTAMGTALTLEARSIDTGGNMYGLAKLLVAGRVAPGPGWAQALGVNVFHIFGDLDLNVAPFLQRLADWLSRQDFTVEIVVKDYHGKQLEQIRSIFPDAVVR